MELRVAAVLLLLTGVIVFTPIEGYIPRCCVQVSKDIACQTLRKVRNFHVQGTAGSCETEALILHIRNMKICADPMFTSLMKDKKRKGKWLKKCKKLRSQMSA